VFGWRRKPGSAPAAGPAVPPETRFLDDWRTLPPPPTVLRSPVTTVATSAFSAGLSAWRNPSFLSSLGHRIDGDGPAGLIAGLARPATSPGPLTYHHDRLLSPAGGRGASLQRSVAFWSPPPAAPSRLVAAPEVDLGPVPVPVVSADPAETRTETVVAPDRETPPPTPLPDPPAACSAPNEIVTATTTVPAGANEATAAEPVSPGGRLEMAPGPIQPLTADRSITDVTAQRQASPTSPHTPLRHRLGLGAPLSALPSGSPARAIPLSAWPVVARYPGSPNPAGASGGTPHEAIPPEQGREAGQPPPGATPGSRPLPFAGGSAGPAGAPEPPGATVVESVHPVPAYRARPPDATPLVQPLPAEGSPDPAQLVERLPGPAPVVQAASAAKMPDPASAAVRPAIEPPAIEPSAEAPLVGELQSALRGDRPAPTEQATAAAPSPTLFAGKTPPDSTALPLQPAAPPIEVTTPAAVQRLAFPSAASPGNPGRNLAVPTLTTRPPADPGPAFVAPAPEPEPADQPGHRPLSAQRLSSDSPAAPSSTRHSAVVSLLGYRPPVRILDASPGSWTTPPAGQAPEVPDGPARVAVQRSVPGPPPIIRPNEWVATPADGPASVGHRESSAGPADPGTIAVSRGLAHRDPDGSVVFDLRPDSVQRQEAAGPAASPAVAPGGLPHPAAVPASPGSVLPAAPTSPQAPVQGPVSPPLDELARQLFGPLTARLKAELRLDRERAGLLTDLRQ
jgi:hypothetical protein